MDRIDLTKTGGIRRTQDVLKFLQQSYTELFAGLAAMIGNNVIVAGVTDLGANYSDGWVVVNGELLPFVGGLKNTRIIVTETIAQSHYGDGADKDAFYTRFAQCAGAGGTAFSAFTRIPNTYQLVTQTQLTTAINNLINGAPGALDTLEELADALGDDSSFATTITNLISTEATNRANGDALKVAKAGDTMTGALILNSTLEPQGGIKTPAGRIMKKEVIDIGNWNMGTTANVIVALPVAYTKIRSINVLIRNDGDSAYYPLFAAGSFGTPGTPQGGVELSNPIVPANTVSLFRAGGGYFVSGNFNSVGGFNRGWVTIEYEA